MRFWGLFPSDDFEDIYVDRGVVLLGGKVSDMLWPVWGSVIRRAG